MAEDIKHPSLEEEREQFKKEYPTLSLFVDSDLTDVREWVRCINEHEQDTSKHISTDGNIGEMRRNVIAYLTSNLDAIAEEMDIKKEDLSAIIKEIAFIVNEETAIKARAIIGRWICNAGWPKVIAYLRGTIKLYIYGRTPQFKGDYEFGDTAVTVSIICLCWSMLIESGVCVEKEIQDNAHYMPETLSNLIFIDRISRKLNLPGNYHLSLCKEISQTKQYQYRVLNEIFTFFLEDINRFDDNHQPHQSNIAYVSTARAAFKRVGGDPSNFVYRCLDNGQNWSLFQFLTADE